jgi:(p)ppGpp synthase/HD superfamily hydrolase
LTANLEKAIALAAKAHEGQRDKAGMPYILHPLRLMLKMDSETEMIAAALHDVIEDSETTAGDLADMGFSDEVLKAVDCLTRRENESYDDFIERAKANPISRKVKIADLEDNMDIKRLDSLTEKDAQRLEKYHRIWRKLTGAVSRGVGDGTSRKTADPR